MEINSLLKSTKKYLSSTMLLFIFSFLFFTCGQEENIVDDNSVIISDAQIQDIALKHNDGLAFVLEGLKKKKNSSGLTEKDFLPVVNQELHNYYKTLYQDQNDLLKKADDLSQSGVSKYLKYSNSGSLLRVNTELTPIESAIAEFKNYLSNNQIELLLQCDKALENATDNESGTIIELNRIRNYAKENLPAEEAQIILIAIEIGKSSLTYWNENFDEWQEVIASTNDQARIQKGWFSGSEVVGADVAGGVTAAVYTAVVNAAPGVGQAAYGSAILAGAVSTSVGDAVLQVWNHFF